jgi:DNA-binding transcriptional LysR family regulator
MSALGLANDLDLRKLRYFLAVAEQLNFTRAAEELHIAQPVLSRQVKALERDLGVELLIRNRRRTELTDAGRQLVADGNEMLAAARGLRLRVTRAAHGSDTFVIGFMPGLTVTEPVRALSEVHPNLTVDVLRTSWDDQTLVLHDGRVDVSYVRLPIDETGVRVAPLFAEPRVAVLPADHPLAELESLVSSDLDGEPRAELRTHSVEEKLEHVAAGRAVTILPLSTATYYKRPDIRAIPLLDAEDSEVALAWLSTRRTPLIAEFVQLATQAVDSLPPERRVLIAT